MQENVNTIEPPRYMHLPQPGIHFVLVLIEITTFSQPKNKADLAVLR